MNVRWLLVFALGLAVVRPACSQATVYADFSASKLTGGLPPTVTTDVLYGGTIGLTAKLVDKAHLKLYGDIRGGFYGGGNGKKLDEVAVGPKVGYAVRRYEASGEMLVGFGRFNDGLGTRSSASTDAVLEFNAAFDRHLTKRFDWRVFEFSYQQYYGLGGEYNPKTFSTGAVFHLGSR